MLHEASAGLTGQDCHTVCPLNHSISNWSDRSDSADETRKFSSRRILKGKLRVRDVQMMNHVLSFQQSPAWLGFILWVTESLKVFLQVCCSASIDKNLTEAVFVLVLLPSAAT